MLGGTSHSPRNKEGTLRPTSGVKAVLLSKGKHLPQGPGGGGASQVG